MKRTIRPQRITTAHVPEDFIRRVMVLEIDRQIGTSGKVDDLNLIWAAERFLDVPTGTDRGWMKVTALAVLRSSRLACCGDGWWRKPVRGRELEEMTPQEYQVENAQALVDMIEAGRRDPHTPVMARVSRWASEGIAPFTRIYKIHIQIDPGDSRRSWGYCEGYPHYNGAPHEPTPEVDFCLPLSEAVVRFVAAPELPFLGLIGFRVVCSTSAEADRREVERYAEMLEGAGRPDLADDLWAVKIAAPSLLTA